MKKLMMLAFTLFTAVNISAYDGNICVADYYNNQERPFVIDCYGVIDSVEVYETRWWSMLDGWYTLPVTDDEKEEYCESVDWEYDGICTNDVYCESIYWEDEDNCTFIQADHLVDEDYCNSNPFESMRKTCLEAVEELNKTNATEG